MLDEKLEDEVWITVVATGYGDRPAERRDDHRWREPVGEPRVERVRHRAPMEVDVPEYLPRR